MIQGRKHKESPVFDLHGAFVRRTNLNGAFLQKANLAGADATQASFRGADLKGTILDGTILRGADLSGAKNLTLEQLSAAVLDDDTVLPDYIDRRKLELMSHLADNRL